MSDKIQPQHLARKAVLYVRQSSAFQVAHNQESQKLQYAMQERCGSWAGPRSRSSMRTWVARRPAPRRAAASSAWSPRSAWDASERSRRARCRALPATAASGSSSSRSAASSIRC